MDWRLAMNGVASRQAWVSPDVTKGAVSRLWPVSCAGVIFRSSRSKVIRLWSSMVAYRRRQSEIAGILALESPRD